MHRASKKFFAPLQRRWATSLSAVVPRKFNKVLVANRGEIAIRVFRTLKEQGIRSVAIYAEQDKKSLHRVKADEAYQVGAGLEPVAAYLDIDSIIRVSLAHNVDAIHPGYGFLSERSDFASRVRDEGMAFIGPSPEVMAKMGDKVEARKSAIRAGVRVVPGTDQPITTAEEAIAFAQKHGTPIILKAAYGGGGRGMRRVDKLDDVAESFKIASHEALVNFGNGSMFVEKFIINPRHIEVQLLGDHHGHVVHFFERDCSIQRRHQKVVEIAPASNLDPEVRRRILDDAVNLARHVGYQNAGTVEFLLDEKGDYYFIEVNARLQVEHTVTEEITGHDLVKSQILVAEGASLPDIGITQDKIKAHGSAIQCRVTTEDPLRGFQPDSGRLETCRMPTGHGVRIDGAAYTGCQVTPFYDSLLVKITTRGPTHEVAAQKMRRCLAEAVVTGVKTNIPFLANVVMHKEFLHGATTTSFIEQNPALLDLHPSRQRGMRLVRYMAECKVNGVSTPLGSTTPPSRICPVPPENLRDGKPRGWRDVLVEKGPSGFAAAIREHKGLLITDTTFRDAHQSLLATRVRTQDLVKISPFVATSMSQLFSLENWGGATFDVCLKFLRECPWGRLEAMREQIPNVPFQCLIRGANAMGYSNYPDNVVNEFCMLAVKSGMDVFRVFDSLNYLPNLLVGIEAVGKAGGVVEAAIAYTGDVGDTTSQRYGLKYYTDLADQLVKAGIHILCVKDMAGVLKPHSAKLLIGTLRQMHPTLPIHVHTHDTAGVGVASMIACAESGADVVDAAIDSMSGMTSQPSMGAIVHSLQGTSLDTGLCTKALSKYNNYWELTRPMYGPFECTTTMKSGNADVFEHQIPGGQYTNLQFQAFSLGLGHKFEQVCKNYIEANKALGDISKVTPSSKVVGDLAQFMTQQKISSCEELNSRADELSFPASVKDYFRGMIGQPPYGFPEELQKKVLRGEQALVERPGKSLPPLSFGQTKKDVEVKVGRKLRDQDVMSYVMFPSDFVEMDSFRSKYGPVECLPTDVFFGGPLEHEEIPICLEEGKTVLARLVSVGNVTADANREVIFEYNGFCKSIFVRDKEASKNIKVKPKATLPEHVGAPMKGKVLDIKVKIGDVVKKKQTLCVLSAMKMEMAVEAKTDGVVGRIEAVSGEEVEAEDLIVVLQPKQ